MNKRAFNLVRGILNSLRDAGLVKVTPIGHEGLWEIELLGDGVSETEHVLGSRPAPSAPPSHTLPPLTPPHPPSYSASAPAPTRETTGKEKSSSPSRPSQPKRSEATGRALGGRNLELFSGQEQLSSKDMQDFQSVWNGTFVLPKIVSMRGREKVLHELLKDDFFRENWRKGVSKVAASKFCRGHNRQGTGQRPWKATVEWFLQPHVLPRILEGKYDNDKEPEIDANDTKFTQETL